MGDFAYPCFTLCKISKKSPFDTAKQIVETLKTDEIIKKIDVNGGYINFYIDEKKLVNETINLILKKQNDYGKLSKTKQNVIIEHTSANPNGPLHVGRARNPIIGDTLVRIFKAAGYSCESQFYLDDLGKQVAILAWGMKNIKKDEITKETDDKPDHKAVVYYQQANKKMDESQNIKDEISDLVKHSESGDKKTIELIHETYNPVLKGINQSLKKINILIDSYIPESNFVKDKSVDDIIDKLKKSKYCFEENGAYYIDMEPFGVKGRNTNFFITRSDGTSLYATRDIAYHVWKAKNAKILINVLGEDHKLEAKQVKTGLTLIGEKTLPKPVFYSFVSLPGGKMSTRHARVVYLDDLIRECIDRAYEEVKKRRGKDLSEDAMRKIAEIIGIGALRYNIIKVQPEKDITFKWEEALNFEGNSAPFIQYAHARASGILIKNKEINFEISLDDLNILTHSSEIALTKKLSLYPQVIKDASEQFKPHLITLYLFEIASFFNQFYRDCPVLNVKDDDLKNARLYLVKSFKIVIRNGLDLLGIIAPDEM
jgi:arginyl-tRNA synthetase